MQKEKIANNYQFQESNPFKNIEGLYEKALTYYNDGNTGNAILAVKQHDDSVDWWRLLGEEHACNDDDDKAIGRFYKTLHINQNDLTLCLHMPYFLLTRLMMKFLFCIYTA